MNPFEPTFKKIYNEEWKYLLCTQRKTNDKKIIQFQDDCFTLYEESKKHQIFKVNSQNIQYSLLSEKNNKSFEFKISFQSQYLIPQQKNSNAMIDWKFVISDKDEYSKLKNDQLTYKVRWLKAYHESDYKEKQKHFFDDFSLYCLESVSEFVKQIAASTPDLNIQRLNFQNINLQKRFQNSKYLYNSLTKNLQYSYKILPQLSCIVVLDSIKYLVQLKINNNQVEQNDGITHLYQNIIHHYQISKDIELQMYEAGDKTLGVLNVNSFDQKLKKYSENLDIQLFDETEIYDREELCKLLHFHGIPIKYLGELAKHTTNKDLSKLCKVEMIARASKTLLCRKSRKIDQKFLTEFLKSFMECIQQQDMNQLHEELKQEVKLKFKFDINTKEIQTNALLLLALMNQLNFYIPINISKLKENSLTFTQYLDFVNIVLIKKCQNFIDVYELPINDSTPKIVFNYEYLKSFDPQSNMQQYYSLIELFLGKENSLYGVCLFQLYKRTQELSHLRKAQEILNKSFPSHQLQQEINQLLNQSSNQLGYYNILGFSYVQKSDQEYLNQAKKQYEQQQYELSLQTLHKITNYNKKNILKLGVQLEIDLKETKCKFQNAFINYCMLEGYNLEEKQQIEKIFFLRFSNCLIQSEIKDNQKYYVLIVSKDKFNQNFLDDFQLQFYEQNCKDFDEYLLKQLKYLQKYKEEIIRYQGKLNEKINSLCNADQYFNHAMELLTYIIAFSINKQR